MPRTVRLSPQAQAWLRREVAYLAERSPNAARRFIALMNASRERLAEYPALAAPGLIPGTRRLVAGPYVLTVRVKAAMIEIAAIRHGRQGDALAPQEAEAED